MAIATKTTYTLQGVTYGCSDPCSTLFANGDLTPSELARFSWCRWEDKYLNCVSSTNINVSTQQGSAVMNLLSYMQPTGATLTTHYVKDRIPTKKPYAFNILVYGNGGNHNITSSNGANYRIVTSCSDFQSLYVKVDKYQDAYNTRSVQFPTARTINVNNLVWSRNAVYNTNTDTYTDYITVWTVYVIDEDTFFIAKGAAFTNTSPCCYPFANNQYNIIPYNRLNISTGQWYYLNSDITNYNGSLHMLRWCSNDFDIEGTVTWDNDVTKYACWDVTSDVSVVMKGYWRNYDFSYYLRTEEAVKNSIAYMGLRWRYENGDTEHIYTPIIDDDGYITGYSTDPEALTKLNDIIDVTGNNITPLPPIPPGPSPGYDDDPWSGTTFSGVGVGGAGAFAKCYYMTSTELANLRSWMNSNNVPEGFDPMQQIIGLSQVPVSLSGDDNTTVQFVNSSAVYDPGVNRVVDSGVNTQISMGTPKKYSLGSVDIVRRMQERSEPYLDYDCQIELYLPLIGVFSLDTQAVMGRTITAEAVLDPISGTLAAYAYVTRDGQNLPVAYGSTTIGVDLPITSQQYSVSRAALKQANAQLGTSLLSSTLSFIAAASAGGKGSGTGAKTATGSTNGLAAAGIREAGADYMKASQAGNVFGEFMQWGRTIRQLSYGNNTAISGSFGGSTAQWSYPFTPYVKIIRPRYKKPSNYAHSQGVPCVQTKTIGSCTGFIQCIGADVSGITGATDIELQAIQAALSNGIFAGGGQ